MTRIFVLLTALAATATASQCYYPDGTVATDDVPCTSEEYSACCGPTTACLDNHYCVNLEEPWMLNAGSCTDVNWESSNCASQCTFNNTRDEGVAIYLYERTDTSYEYCCSGIMNDGDNGTTCVSGSTFRLDSGTVIIGVAALANYTTTSTNATATTTVTASSTATGTSSASTSSLDCSVAAADGSKSTSHDVAIGAGVGVPLGVIALLVTTWAFWERGQRKKLEMNFRVQPGQMNEYDSYKNSVPGELPSQPVRPQLSEIGGRPLSEIGVTPGGK
ncbi:hypothetical protein ASPZODRAFT_1294569 [Penicilliopsis zonata CBS 506.65]|uniref:Mid2 domain-containing protein n=1 Tax=Penicilliopsis zonata CBS 506.65 TaxID=1073090 RepID=A0A1L9S6E7_9EURO|nr:hypothetical protein ASPZODRAFT_1294569 [Penicilliopsis zonata CBS 506.65]OJJ42717.1 hypothetical protein ASPZODRAFT_1294569 [Penicilliopsis zonata CBS 506.65]